MRKKLILLIVLVPLTCLCLILAVLLTLSACTDRPVRARAGPYGVGGIGGEPTTVIMDLWVSKRCPARGEKVTIRYILTNQGPGRLVVRLDKQPPVMDIIVQVTGPEASVLQRWSDGKPLDELKQLELAPGQSKTISMEWTVPDTLGASSVNIDMHFLYRDDPLRAESGGLFLPIAPMCPGY